MSYRPLCLNAGGNRPSGALLALLGLSCALVWTGCSKEESSYYESSTADAETETADASAPAGDVGVEEALPPGHPPIGEQPPLPPGHPPMDNAMLPPPGTMDMQGQTLPDELVAKGDIPDWELPEGWTQTETRAMRRANFALGESGLEVAVTSFPGDVGGLPANVNRWRRQLGLPPIGEGEMLPFLTQTSINGKDVLFVDLLGPPQPEGAPTQRMLTAVANHAGASWFFKLTGDAPTVEKHRAEFVEFVRSLRFPGDDATPAP